MSGWLRFYFAVSGRTDNVFAFIIVCVLKWVTYFVCCDFIWFVSEECGGN